MDENAEKLVKRILELTHSRFVSANDISRLAELAKPETIQQKIYFLTQVKEVIRLLPEKMFPDYLDANRNRENLIDAAKQAIDQAIAEEEELESE